MLIQPRIERAEAILCGCGGGGACLIAGDHFLFTFFVPSCEQPGGKYYTYLPVLEKNEARERAAPTACASLDAGSDRRDLHSCQLSKGSSRAA